MQVISKLGNSISSLLNSLFNISSILNFILLSISILLSFNSSIITFFIKLQIVLKSSVHDYAKYISKNIASQA